MTRNDKVAAEAARQRIADNLAARGLHPIPEYRHNRNFVRVGDVVIARPHGTVFTGRVLRILATDDGTPVEIDVTPVEKNGHTRIVTPDRITRKAQTRQEAG